MKPWIGLAATLGFTSCMVGPNYRPQTPEQLRVPEAWHAALPDKAQSGDFSVWWRQLGDPLLSEFVEEALQPARPWIWPGPGCARRGPSASWPRQAFSRRSAPTGGASRSKSGGSGRVELSRSGSTPVGSRTSSAHRGARCKPPTAELRIDGRKPPRHAGFAGRRGGDQLRRCPLAPGADRHRPRRTWPSERRPARSPAGATRRGWSAAWTSTRPGPRKPKRGPRSRPWN